MACALCDSFTVTAEHSVHNDTPRFIDVQKLVERLVAFRSSRLNARRA